MRIVWTAPALGDLSAARAFITLDSPAAARRQVEYVVAAVETLPRFPESGRPGRTRGIRELVVGHTPFVVAYRVSGDVIEILRVMHGRQRWPARF
jgi:toxin ParE1/3/4